MGSPLSQTKLFFTYVILLRITLLYNLFFSRRLFFGGYWDNWDNWDFWDFCDDYFQSQLSHLSYLFQ